MVPPVKITSPTDTSLAALCEQLAQMAPELERPAAWPGEQLRLCAEAGVYEWFLPKSMGGQGWAPPDIAAGYFQLSAACLTTTFVITQLMGANRRLAGGDNFALRDLVVPKLVSGAQYATVGISHLTTSRRHLARPALCFQEDAEVIVLNGFSPWVTGAAHCDYVLAGAASADGEREVLALVPLKQSGVSVDQPSELVALSASQTGAVRFEQVRIEPHWIVAGPMANVMQSGVGAGTGGIQTSTLAVGLTTAAVRFLRNEATRRPELGLATEKLAEELVDVRQHLVDISAERGTIDVGELRTRANSLVLRATQAALVAAKGTGYVIGHPAGRWCREALFFLVWSCPQSVLEANLCELAGVAD